MNRIFRIPSPRSVSFIVVIYSVIIILVLLWAAQLLGTVTRDDPGQTPVLLVLSIIFPAALLLLSVINLTRVIVQRRAGIPGSRFRMRLIGAFTLIVFVTAIPIGLLSSMFLRAAIDQWLAPENGRALEAGEGQPEATP